MCIVIIKEQSRPSAYTVGRRGYLSIYVRHLQVLGLLAPGESMVGSSVGVVGIEIKKLHNYTKTKLNIYNTN